MFDRYARGGRSLQVATKGHYWAGRAALAAGRLPRPTAISSAPRPIPNCSTASWRSSGSAGRSRRRAALPTIARHRRASARRSSSSAWSGRLGCSASRAAATSRALFVRALSEALTNDADRVLAVELGQQIGRPGPRRCGSRARRATNGSAFYVRPAFPTCPASACRRAAVVADPRHHPPGKLVRPHRGQPRRRARHDAADARHGARAGRQDGRRL